MKYAKVMSVGFVGMLVVSLFGGECRAQMNPAFCDGFEDGSGFTSRWTSIDGSIQEWGDSPVHDGAGAVDFKDDAIGGGLMSTMYRSDFAAYTGEYSAWAMVDQSAVVSILTLVSPDPDEYPTWAPGYGLSAGAIGTIDEGLRLLHYSGIGNQGDGVLLGTLPTQFASNEWVRLFIRIMPCGVIVAGCEHEGVIDSMIVIDQQPILTPGRFYLGSATYGGREPGHFDDACYEPLLCSYEAICFDRLSDIDCDGFVTPLDLGIIIDQFFAGAPMIPCPNDPSTP